MRRALDDREGVARLGKTLAVTGAWVCTVALFYGLLYPGPQFFPSIALGGGLILVGEVMRRMK